MSENISDILNERFLLQEEYLGENKKVNKITPLVSITVATYQHVKYIKQCLDGILMQKTTFPIEVILGEDGSIDGTQQICIEYAEKYPDIIRLFIRDRNLSQFKDDRGIVIRFNGIWNRMSARGKYIAWCEGDDYWIDPLKLQKQVDFLETNPDYSMCFHNAIKLFENNQVEIFNSYKCDCDLNIHDAIHDWVVPTASIVGRKDVIAHYPSWLSRIYSGDYSTILLCVHSGKVRYFNNIMSIYRMSYTGTSMTSLMKNKNIFMLEQKIILLDSFNKGTNYLYKKEIEDRVKYLKREIIFQNAKQKKNLFQLILMPDMILTKLHQKIKDILPLNVKIY